MPGRRARQPVEEDWAAGFSRCVIHLSPSSVTSGK